MTVCRFGFSAIILLTFAVGISIQLSGVVLEAGKLSDVFFSIPPRPLDISDGLVFMGI